MRFQIEFRPVPSYGLGVTVRYFPGKAFALEALLWNRLLVVGWERA